MVKHAFSSLEEATTWLFPPSKLLPFKRLLSKLLKIITLLTTKAQVVNQTPSNYEITLTLLCLCTGFQRPGYSPPIIQGHSIESINFS